MAHGVRKVNEYIMRDGRALILTEEVSAQMTLEQWNGVGEGTIIMEPSTGLIRYKHQNSGIAEWTKFVPEVLFDPLTVNRGLIANYSINNIKIDDNAVSTRVLQRECVENSKILNNTITEEKLKPVSFTGNIFIDGSVSGNKIIDNSLNGAKIVNASIEHAKLADKCIYARHMTANSITTDNNALSDGVVNNAKIANLAVTEPKMAADSVTLENAALKNGVVLNEKLADNSVSDSKMRPNSISIANNALQDGVVTTVKIAAKAIDNTKLAANSITQQNQALADGVVTNSKISNDTISHSKLDSSLRAQIDNAIKLENGVAVVRGTLRVDENIVSKNNDCSYSITGFKVFNPVFRDFAEAFVVSEPVEIGDIVEIDKCECVKKASSYSTKMVGVVSDQYALCLGASEEELLNGSKTAIGLVGRVYINVAGTVEPGDFIVSCGNGIGLATKKYIPGAVIAKALTDKTSSDIGKVLCLIQSM